jgi:hypothetical protein
MTDDQGKEQYSKILAANPIESLRQNQLNIAINPIVNDLVINYESLNDTPVTVNIYNSVGGLIYTAKKLCVTGSNQITIPDQFVKQKSTYMIEFADGKSNPITARAIRL